MLEQALELQLTGLQRHYKKALEDYKFHQRSYVRALQKVQNRNQHGLQRARAETIDNLNERAEKADRSWAIVESLESKIWRVKKAMENQNA